MTLGSRQWTLGRWLLVRLSKQERARKINPAGAYIIKSNETRRPRGSRYDTTPRQASEGEAKRIAEILDRRAKRGKK